MSLLEEGPERLQPQDLAYILILYSETTGWGEQVRVHGSMSGVQWIVPGHGPLLQLFLQVLLILLTSEEGTGCLQKSH